MAKSQSQFVRAVTESNLSTYFLLPLIELSKFSFGAGNFIDSYVNSDGTVLTVELVDFRLCPTPSNMHPEYLNQRETLEHSYIWFSLPEKWRKDFECYKNGHYSRFSEDAKTSICTFSGLTFMGGPNSDVTDARLLALGNSAVLRERWEEELTVPSTRGIGKPVTLPDELLDIPSERAFREYEYK